MASLLGVNVDRTISLTFVLGAALAAVAGTLFVLYYGGPLIGLGYSNGANILASVMMAHPELVDAGVLMHPLIPFDPPAQPGLQALSALVTAGQRDPICPMPSTVALWS